MIRITVRFEHFLDLVGKYEIVMRVEGRMRNEDFYKNSNRFLYAYQKECQALAVECKIT
jgi:hypothetical protein